MNIWQSYRQVLIVSYTVRLANTLLKDEESARDTFLLVTLPNIYRLKIFFFTQTEQ